MTRPPVVEETVPETVPETTVAPTTLPAPPPSYPMETVPPPQLGRSARSTIDAHEDMHADAPAASTEHGNQALEAVLVALTVSLLAGGFWSARRYT